MSTLAPLELSRHRAGGVAVITVAGELDIARCPRLGVTINEVIRSAPSVLVIDLCGVTFADSIALAMLLNAWRRTLRAGIEFRIACGATSTLKLLKLTRLDTAFEIHSSLEAALEASGQSAENLVGVEGA